jgi:peptidoglycan/LPS O-acetylase OafA/YrhL
MPSTITQAGELRLRSLESVRALCALGVLAGHVFAATEWGAIPAGRWFDGLAAGVYVFFVLSGYLIYRPFARRDFGDGARIDLSRYFANRALRLLPAYYLVVVILLMVQEDGGSGTQWLRFLTWTQNLFASTLATVNPPLWTVVAELQFYLVLPAVAWLVALMARGSHLRALAVLLVIAGLTAAIPFSIESNLRYPLPQNGFLFLAGMILALAQTDLERFGWHRLPALFRSAPIWLALAVTLWAISVAREVQSGVTMALASALLVGACVLPTTGKWVIRPFESGLLARVGLISYGIYLWHQPVIDWIADGQVIGKAQAFGLLLVVLAASMVAGALSYICVERPFLRLRRPWFRATEAEVDPRTNLDTTVSRLASLT